MEHFDSDIKSPRLPDRKNPRADFHDYNGGAYFVTICTHHMRHYFGHINDERMYLTEIGRFTSEALEHIAERLPYAQIAQYVVMPNHIHLVVVISDDKSFDHLKPPKRSPLSVVIGLFKRGVSAFARTHSIPFRWQTGYHDHIIRGTADANNIDDYIANNVVRWSLDRYNTDSQQ